MQRSYSLLLTIALAMNVAAAQGGERPARPGRDIKPSPQISDSSATTTQQTLNSSGANTAATTSNQSAPNPFEAPATPAKSVASPAQVTYNDGLLTVRAENATLNDVLRQIQQRTGARVEAPAGLTGERIYFNSGPAPAPDILLKLLAGSPNFNYIILAAPEDADKLQRVILTARVGNADAPRPQPTQGYGDDTMDDASLDDDQGGPVNEQQPAYQQPLPQPQQGRPDYGRPGTQQGVQPNQPGTQPFPNGVNPPTGSQPPTEPGTPAAIQPGQAAPAQPQPQPGQVKTPEQLLRELQELRRQEQLRQQNQQPSPR